MWQVTWEVLANQSAVFQIKVLGSFSANRLKYAKFLGNSESTDLVKVPLKQVSAIQLANFE